MLLDALIEKEQDLNTLPETEEPEIELEEDHPDDDEVRSTKQLAIELSCVCDVRPGLCGG